jgi:hypothetical protein
MTRSNRRSGIAFLLLAALVLPAAPLEAQDDGSRDPASVFGAGPSYRSWDIEDGATTTISQFHFPFSQTVPLGRWASLMAAGAYATTTLKLENGDEATLSGLTDVRLKGTYRPMGRAQVSLGVNLPVGKETLVQGSAEVVEKLRALHEGDDGGAHHEIEVAQAMWSPILGFRTKRMGAGFDMEFGAGYAVPLSPTATLGLGAAYITKGEYDLFETEDGVTSFKPGPEASATIGVDFRPGQNTLLRFDLTGRTYGDDESNDEPVFKAGTQIEVDVLLARTTSAWSLGLRGRSVTRSDDELVSGAGEDVVRTAVSATPSVWGLGEAYRQLSPRLALGAELQAGSFGESETVLSDGKTFAIGPGLRIGSAGGRRLTLRALYLTGSAGDGDVDLSGYDLSAAAAISF